MDEDTPLTEEALAEISRVFVEISPAAALGFREDPPSDSMETLLDLARAGDEAGFKDLARAIGVPPDRLDGLWSGAVSRLRA